MTQRQGQDPRLDTSRTIRAPHGNKLRAKSWLTEAPLRMLMNNLDPGIRRHWSRSTKLGMLRQDCRSTGKTRR